MKVGPLASFACLGVASAFVGASSLAAGVAGDPLAAEAEVRRADAEWSAAASSHRVEAWMSFYSADAIVRFPQEPLASGRELVRQAVARFLGPAPLSMASRPIDVQVSSSADAASLIETYELRVDSQGKSVSSRGRRLEIWKKQADGSWKCIVDTWNLDESPGAPAAAPMTSAPMAPMAPLAPPAPSASAAPVARPEPTAAAPSAAPAPVAPPPVHEATTKYADAPVNYDQTIRQYFQDHLAHPEGVQYREITPPEEGYVDKLAGGLLMHQKRVYGWIVKATLNTQDSKERYIGFRTYNFLFRGEKIVDARSAMTGEQVR